MLIADTIGRRGESRMKDNNIRKVALIAILLLCCHWQHLLPQIRMLMMTVILPGT